MKQTSEIYINAYSFAFGFGLLGSRREISCVDFLLRLEQIADLHGLAGIEIPVDLRIGDRLVFDYLTDYSWGTRGNKFFYCLEDFSRDTLQKIAAKVADSGNPVVRIKMPQFRPVSYGGNRASVIDFKVVREKFISEIQASLPICMNYGLTLAIENHQDLTAQELIEICESFKGGCVGITWDVGNSFATSDTPENFYSVTKDYIRHIHLKDYKLSLTERGLGLTRCILGEGAVDFEFVFRRTKGISKSIELGAHLTRICRIFDESYFENMGISMTQRAEFIKLIRGMALDSQLLSDYENGMRDAQLDELEFEQADKSSGFICELNGRVF